MPPTPTPFPPGQAHFELPTEFSLWGGTDLAVQAWNWLGDARVVIQALIIVIIVAAGIYIALRFIRENTQEDASE